MNPNSLSESSQEPSRLFSPLVLKNITLKNRIIRSAGFEGMGDRNGFPKPELADTYLDLARGGVGAIITGFAFVSQEGRAMQPAQCGIDRQEKVPAWKDVITKVKRDVPDVKLFLQLAHTGRQTLETITGMPVVGASTKKCNYFRQSVRALDDVGVRSAIDAFIKAAVLAKESGFDGVQVHAAHGYLVHQFLSPWTNTRTDRWADKPLFLEEIVLGIKQACGKGFPVLIKISWAEDNTPGIRIQDAISTVKRIAKAGIDAVEVSYGTMEHALNIIRGDCPVDAVLKVNPLFNRIPPVLRDIWKFFRAKSYMSSLIPFSEGYNVEAAVRIRAESGLPVIAVGGMRSRAFMADCLVKHGLDGVSLCRPLICEPDLPAKFKNGTAEISECTSCNLCAVNCDSTRPLRCYRKRGEQS